MYLSADYTCLRLAALNDVVRERLISKYNSELTVDEVAKLEAAFSEFGNKADLVTEWAVKSISQYEGSERFPHLFAAMARFYFQAVKTPKFREAVDEYAGRQGETFHYKNLLDFTLWSLDGVKDLYDKPAPDPRMLQMPAKLPEGARIVASYGDYHFVEVTSVPAACALGDSTDWCTRHEEAAEGYISEGPLYVIYYKKKKIAQLFISTKWIHKIELNDRKNDPIRVDENMGELLWKTGFLPKILDVLESHEDQVWATSGHAESWMQFPKKEVESYIVNKPYTATAYAMWILKGPWPDAEPTIANDVLTAFTYAAYVLKRRFPDGEHMIFQSQHATDGYLRFLQKKDPEGYAAVMAERSPGTKV